MQFIQRKASMSIITTPEGETSPQSFLSDAFHHNVKKYRRWREKTGAKCTSTNFEMEKKKIITHQSLHLQPSRSAVKVGAERWQLLSQGMSIPGCLALGKGVMGRRAGKALVSQVLECRLSAHPAAPAGSRARKAEQQHPPRELCRLVSI